MSGFKFSEFDAKCSELDVDQLQQKWQHYDSALSAASTSTAVSTMTTGPTEGVTMIGAMIAGPLMHNASKKRQIIERHMSLKGAAPDTRARKQSSNETALPSSPEATTEAENSGAEALAVDKVTKIVSHAVLDGAMANGKGTNSQEVSTQEQHLTRSGSMPSTVTKVSTAPSTGSNGNEQTAGTSLKHSNTLPGSLGSISSSASGLFASASRMTAEKYPLIKEYISSIAVQSKTYMPFTKPGGNGLSPAGRNWAEPVTASAVDFDPLPGENSTPKSTPSSSTPQPAPASAPQSFIAELEGDSYYSSSLVSPMGSSIAEMEGEFDPGVVSPCDTLCTTIDGDHVFDNLLKNMDETALSEIENELAMAINQMDDATPTPDDVAGSRVSRAFHDPSDLDTIVRRQSTRYSKRCNVRAGKYPSDEKESIIEEAEVAPLRSPRTVSGHDSKVSRDDMEKEYVEPASPTGTILPAYAETDPSIAPEVWCSDTGSSSLIPSPSECHDNCEKQAVESMPPAYMRGGNLSHRDSSASTASSTRLIMSDPTSSELVVSMAPEAAPSSEMTSKDLWAEGSKSVEVLPQSPPSPTQSTFGRRAMTVHSGMKKIGYLGLEPAAKLAVGGSLLLMGVRPSVQRKMLDKAKNKMGMPEKTKKRDVDDDYKDYI